MADLMRQPDDRAPEVSTVPGNLTSARRAMWSRDLATARRHVEAATGAARTPTERTNVQRARRLLDSLETFWNAVREAAGQLAASEELPVGDALVMVVETGDGSLTVRALGRNYTYRIEDLPRSLAVALAQRNLPKGSTLADLSIGSFLAIDRRGDRHQAYVRWQRAGAEGESLLTELALAPPPQGAEPEEPARSPVLLPGVLDGGSLPGGSGEASQPPATARTPIPEAVATARAERELRELFGDDIDLARKAEQKKALASRLFDLAGQLDDDPAARYVLSTTARDLAVEAGDLDTLCRIIDDMDWRYQIDGLGMKADALAKAWRSDESRSYRKALTERTVELLEAAIQAKHFAAAEVLVRVAQHGARATGDLRLARQLEERSRQIKASLRGGP